MIKCSNPDCYAPDVGCSLGTPDISKCEHWNCEINEDEDKASNFVLATDIHLPWTGAAFGLTDVGFLSGCFKPKIVGILGAENAGKTSLLASWYLMISRGLSLNIQSQFAGSYSLAGWEAVSANLRWEPGHIPCFPAHTPSGIKRAPGLLHMAFKNKNEGIVEDYLFADAPGEWFSKWAANSEAPDAEGARWLSTNADMFLLVADRQALSGDAKGRARSELNRLIQRLGGILKNRPIALVWSKSDMPKDEIIENSIRTSTFSVMPQTTEFEIQILGDENATSSPEKNILNLLDWVLDQKKQKGKLPAFEYKGNDPLFMFGRGF